MGMPLTRCSVIICITAVLTSLIACGGQQARRNIVLSEAARGIGEAYMRQGDYTAALGKLLEAEKLNPKDHFVHHDLGLCYRAKGRLQDALSHLKKAVALKPSFSVGRNTLGRVYLESGEYDQAITTLKELTRDALYATPHFPLSNLGEAYFYKQDFPHAIDHFERALKVNPDFVPALHGLGRSYVAMARGRLALGYLQKAIKLAPNVPQIHFDAAEAYEQVGQIQQARVSYQSVVDLAAMESPLSIHARQRLAALR